MRAIAEMFVGRMAVFQSERLLFIGFARCIKNGVLGRNGKRRVEYLLTRIMQANKISNEGGIAGTRKNVKLRLRDIQAALDRFASTFLIGRPAPFTAEDVRNFLSKSKSPEKLPN